MLDGVGSKAVRTLRAASVSFSLRRLSLGEALRAAAACATMVAAASLFHTPDFAWAAIGALWTCLADPGGLGRTRLRAIGGFVVLSTVFSVLVAAAAAGGWGMAAAAVLPCAFFGTLLRVYGGEAAQAGTLAVVACVVAVDWPVSSPHDLAILTAYYAGGCAWALVLSLTVWRIHPYAPARRALEGTCRSLGAMASALAKLDAGSGDAAWGRHAQMHRAAVRASVEASRAAVRDVTAQRGGTMTSERLVLTVDVADRIFALLIALSHRLELQADVDLRDLDLQRRALGELAAVLERFALAFRRNDTPSSALHGADAELLCIAAALHGPKAEAEWLREIAQQIRVLADPGFVTLRASSERASRPRATLAPLIANLTWASTDLRHALRCAVTVAAVVLVTHAARVPYAYWATMATVLVQQPSIATTSARALERVVGSTLGGALAAVLGLELHSAAALTAAVFPLAALTMAFRFVNYSLFVLFLTPLFVLTVDLTQPGTDKLHLAGVRALNNVAGALVALLGTLVLWPSWEPGRLRPLLADAIDANARYATFVFAGMRDGRAVDDARRAAGVASSNAEAARERSALESLWRGGMLQAAIAVLVLLRGLAGIATAAWLDPRAQKGDAELEAWLRDAASALAARLRDAETNVAFPPAPAADGNAARAVQQMALLATAVERFTAAIRR